MAKRICVAAWLLLGWCLDLAESRAELLELHAFLLIDRRTRGSVEIVECFVIYVVKSLSELRFPVLTFDADLMVGL